MAGLQFQGADAVVKAYESMADKMPVWAICSGKALNMAGEGASELSNYLDILQADGSAVLYTLQVYNSTSADDITQKTPCNRSINFKLNTAPARNMSGHNLPAAANPLEKSLVGMIADEITGEITEEIRGVIRKRLSGKKEDTDSEPKDLIGTITGILQDPVQLQNAMQLLGMVKQMFRPGSMPYVAPPVQYSPQMVSGVGSPADKVIDQRDMEQRLANALDTLEEHDPKMTEHIEKLARLAKENPGVYSMAIKQLEGLIK